MIESLASFFASFIISFAIIKSMKYHAHVSGDFPDCDYPQKFHTNTIPRIGGISIFLGLLLGVIISCIKNQSQDNSNALILICALPIFLIGLAEDLTKRISPRIRIIVIATFAFFCLILLNIRINRVDIYGIDLIMAFVPISILFTVLAITGLANAYNIIDGFNGLSSLIGIITLCSIIYISNSQGDQFVAINAAILAAALLGFFAWNYPRGLIFMGDSGSYLIGFWIGMLTLLMVSRNNLISPWVAISLNLYPITETLFTIYRRAILKRTNAFSPDGLHLHSLIYRRLLISHSQPYGIVKSFKGKLSLNSSTSPYLWALSLLGMFPALVFPSSTTIQIFWVITFVLIYIFLYTKIIKFKIHNTFKNFKKI